MKMFKNLKISPQDQGKQNTSIRMKRDWGKHRRAGTVVSVPLTPETINTARDAEYGMSEWVSEIIGGQKGGAGEMHLRLHAAVHLRKYIN